MGKGNVVIKDWSSLHFGRIKELVTGDYESMDAFMEALGQRGVMMSVSGPKGTQHPYWALQDGKPYLVIGAEPGIPWVVRVAGSYSAAD
jgi:hypothetical protein